MNHTKQYQGSPLCSIIVNCYNGSRFLRQSLDSIVAQTYQNWELIFWDNQSTDDSAVIFSSYIDPRFRYFYATRHTLLYEARNLAVEKSSGDLIAFLDVDDLWLPDKLAQQVQLFQDPEVGFSCTNYYIRNDLKSTQSLAYSSSLPAGRVLDVLLQHYYVGMLTLLVRRSSLKNDIAPFDPRYHIIGDYDLVIRLSAISKLAVIQQPMAVYRIHGDNESSRHRKLQAHELELWNTENSHNPLVSNSRSFYAVSHMIAYQKALANLFDGSKLDALRSVIKIPFSSYLLRAIIFLLLPRRIFIWLMD